MSVCNNRSGRLLSTLMLLMVAGSFLLASASIRSSPTKEEDAAGGDFNYPLHLWRFEDPSDLGRDYAEASWHNSAWQPKNLTIEPAVQSFEYSDDGVVGNFAGCGFNCSLDMSLGVGESLEFIFRSNSSGYFLTGPGRMYADNNFRTLDYPWNANVFEEQLTGTGAQGMNYASSGWHTIAISRNSSGGVLFCLDGIFCHDKMTNLDFDGWNWELIPPTFLENPNKFWLGIYVDEIAIYNGSLSKESMYQHYLNVLEDHIPYNFQIPGPNAPSAPEPTYPPKELNPLEFPPGTNLTVEGGGGNPTTGVNISALDQLQQFPDPRYAESAETIKQFERNFNWMDPGYMAGRGQPGVTPEEVVKGEIALQELLYKKYHYGVVLSNLRSCCQESFSETVEAASNYTDKVDVIILRLQTLDGSRLRSHDLPDGCYLQNSEGKFLNGASGSSNPVSKEEASLRPLTPESAIQVGCNASVWAHDGRAFNHSLNTLQYDYLDRYGMKFDRINNDGEAINIQDTHVCLTDPIVAKDYKASGAPDFLTYWSQWREYMSVPTFSDLFMNFRGNASGRYTQYQIQGTNPYFGNWSVTRNIMQPVQMKSKTGRDEEQFYSCADFYPRNPETVFHSAGPWHGMDWMRTVRASEIRNGNPWFSPFVAAGWSGEVEMNIRPAQWLGLLKIFGAWGAEFYYAGFFSTGKPFPNSKNWIWQAAIPSYAQAITTHYADVFFNGTFAGFCETGYSNVFCALRKSNYSSSQSQKEQEFIIVLTVQPTANWVGNAVQSIKNVTIALPTEGAGSNQQNGEGSTIVVQGLTARRQGSVYRYSVSSGKLDWLDEWHQDSHPIYWETS